MSTISKNIGAGNDNGYYAGGWLANQSVCGIGKAFIGTVVYSAFRFLNITIPAGSTITSAYLKLKADGNDSDTIDFKLYGIDEDDAGDFASDPGGRSKTTANANWQIAGVTNNTVYTSPDIKSLIQEIIDRGGWVSGNDIAIITADNGTSNDKIIYFQSYSDGASNSALLEINYTEPTTTTSTSTSTSTSSSTSSSTTSSSTTTRTTLTSSSTTSTSTSTSSTSTSTSTSTSSSSSSTSSSSTTTFFGMKISKDTYNVLSETNPNNLIYSSAFNTLKYFTEGTITIHVVQGADEFYAQNNYVELNLDRYLYHEVYVKDDLMTNYQSVGRFQAGSGAYRSFAAHVTKNRLYVRASGWSGSGGADYIVTFKYKVFRNNLGL